MSDLTKDEFDKQMNDLNATVEKHWSEITDYLGLDDISPKVWTVKDAKEDKHAFQTFLKHLDIDDSTKIDIAGLDTKNKTDLENLFDKENKNKFKEDKLEILRNAQKPTLNKEAFKGGAVVTKFYPKQDTRPKKFILFYYIAERGLLQKIGTSDYEAIYKNAREWLPQNVFPKKKWDTDEHWKDQYDENITQLLNTPSAKLVNGILRDLELHESDYFFVPVEKNGKIVYEKYRIRRDALKAKSGKIREDPSKSEEAIKLSSEIGEIQDKFSLLMTAIDAISPGRVGLMGGAKSFNGVELEDMAPLFTNGKVVMDGGSSNSDIVERIVSNLKDEFQYNVEILKKTDKKIQQNVIDKVEKLYLEIPADFKELEDAVKTNSGVSPESKLQKLKNLVNMTKSISEILTAATKEGSIKEFVTKIAKDTVDAKTKAEAEAAKTKAEAEAAKTKAEAEAAKKAVEEARKKVDNAKAARDAAQTESNTAEKGTDDTVKEAAKTKLTEAGTALTAAETALTEAETALTAAAKKAAEAAAAAKG